jgi:hypothetical protein
MKKDFYEDTKNPLFNSKKQATRAQGEKLANK